MSVDLTVSIINTNNRELLRNCLRSIFENTRRISLEVYVVDNACTDGSAEMVEAEFPQVRLIRNEQRLGFCANHNQVLRIGQGRYLCILNEDTVILPDSFDILVDFMDEHPRVGAVGPMSLFPDGRFQASYCDFPTLWTGLLTVSGLSRYVLNPYHPSYPPERSLQAKSVDWVGGVCIVVRREVVEQVGPLDERFLVYSEEVDWCYRMWQAGWQVWYIPEAQILHVGEGTWATTSSTIQLHKAKSRVRLARSQYVFFRKHYGLISASLFQVFFAVITAMRIFILAAWWLMRQDGTVKEQLAVYREGIWLRCWESF